MKLQQLFEGRIGDHPYRSGLVVNDEEARIEDSATPGFEYTVGAGEYADWTTWEDAERIVNDVAPEVQREFQEFKRQNWIRDGKVKIAQDEQLVVLVPTNIRAKSDDELFPIRR